MLERGDNSPGLAKPSTSSRMVKGEKARSKNYLATCDVQMWGRRRQDKELLWRGGGGFLVGLTVGLARSMYCMYVQYNTSQTEQQWANKN